MDFSKCVLGIELGTTRIKAVLLDETLKTVGTGAFEWENHLVNNVFTYPMEEVHAGVRACYAALKNDVLQKTGERIRVLGGIGVSAMMHGYLPLDRDGVPLTEFRTWRNTMTEEASNALSQLFDYNIPQRWGIAHLYQAILRKEAHVPAIAHLTSLPIYVTRKLSGSVAVGLGEASGLFPIDFQTKQYDRGMVEAFDELIRPYGFPWKILDLLPEPLPAGSVAGTLTEEGARFLDPSGDLQPGIPIAPAEGDADTGLVATNTIRPGTGNVSAGTSIFTLLVLDREVRSHSEVCLLSTPDGHPVAMAHGSNCTSDLNAWISLFHEFSVLSGNPLPKEEIYPIVFREAMKGDPDCGGLLSYNYFSGENVTHLNEGRPAFLRTEDARFTLANFMRTHLFSAFATMRIALDVLTRDENVTIRRLVAHGGIFKTPLVAQKLLSAAVGAVISVYPTAGEGGAYGMALLTAYMARRETMPFPDFLDRYAFSDVETLDLCASPEEMEGFERFLARYKRAFPVEKTAVELVK